MRALRGVPLTGSIPAPVTIVDVIALDDMWNVAWGPHPLSKVSQAEDQGRCYHCGQRITWRVVVSGADGAYHVVGQTCANTLGFASKGTLNLAVTRAEWRGQNEHERLEAAEVVRAFLKQNYDALSNKSHPMAASKSWAKKLSMVDYITWWIDNAKAKGADLERALGTAQRALGMKTKADLAEEQRRAELKREAARIDEVEREAQRVTMRAFLLEGVVDRLVENVRVKLIEIPEYRESVVILRKLFEDRMAALTPAAPGSEDEQIVAVARDMAKRLNDLLVAA